MIIHSIKQDWHDYASNMMTGKAYNQHSIDKSGEGQYDGTIGELAFRHELRAWRGALDFKYVAKEKRPYDFIVDGSTIDVKTKARTVDCLPHYTCHVEQRIKSAACDYYVFANHNERKATIALLGAMPKSDFWDRCTARRLGDKDGSHTTSKDSSVVAISELTPIETFLAYAKYLGI